MAITSNALVAAGNRNALTWPDSVTFGVDHDVLGRPSLLGGGLAYIGYGDNGAPNGISRANGIMTWFGHDGAQRLSTLRHFATASGDVQWTLGYNPAGQISSHSRDNDNYAWTGHYAINRAYTANGLNQYTAAGSASFGYDDNGNLISDGTNTWLYDHENRLVGAGAATLAYDPLGRLFSLTSGSTTTTFLYDGRNLVAEYNGATMLRRHLHWGALDTPAVTFDGAGFTQPHWLHADERGSIVASSDGNGAPTINTYDEQGIPGAGNSGRFGFTGQIWLPEIGLYYYRARIYSPTLGRFMQTDPIGYGDGLNLYAYVRNDPVNLVDPLGTCSTGPDDPCSEGPRGPFIGGHGLGGAGGRGGSSAMVGQPTVSENSETDETIVVTALPRLQQAQLRIGPRPNPMPFFVRPPILPRPSVPYPRSPLEPPGPGWRWRGSGPPESGRGNWVSPDGRESLHPDLLHRPPIRPHYDYRAPDGSNWRWFRDGTWEYKGPIA